MIFQIMRQDTQQFIFVFCQLFELVMRGFESELGAGRGTPFLRG
jgi:hypothetical protein